MRDESPTLSHHLPPFPPFLPVTMGNRALTGMSIDICCVWLSIAGAHLLRYGEVDSPFLPFSVFLLTAGLLKVATFREFQLYQGLWRHAGTPEAVRLFQSSSVASTCMLGAFLVLPQMGPPPIALLILDWLLTITTTAGWRFGRRALRQYQKQSRPVNKRVLIYGTDDDGILLLRYLRCASSPEYSVVGFLSPDQGGLRLRGLPVVGNPADVNVDGIIVPASPTGRERDLGQIADECAPLGLFCHQFKLKLLAAEPAPAEGKQNEPRPADD